MANANSVPFFSTDPNTQASYLDLQTRQAMAQALLQQGMTPMDTAGRQIGGVAYHISPLEGLGKLAQAVAGRKMLTDNNQAMGGLMANYNQQLVNMMGGGQGGQGGQPQPQSDPVPQSLAQGALNGSVGPTNANAQRLAAALQAPGVTPGTGAGPGVAPASASAGTSQLNPNGLPPGLAAYAFQTDPSKYLETVIGQMAPTDFQKMAKAAGLNPGTPQYQAAMQDWVTKQTNIPPVPIRPGGGIQNQKTGQITTMPSAAPPGFQNVQAADGSWVSIPVRGGTTAQTQSTAATEAGKAPYQMVEGYDPGTNAPYKNYAGNLIQTPPIPGQGPARSRAEAGMAAQVQGGMGADPAALDREIAATQQGITRVSDPQSKQMLQGYLGTLQQQKAALGGQGARPPGIQTGAPLGQAQGATNAQNELSTSWQSQQVANQQSQTNVSLLQQMHNLADSAISGYEPDKRTYLTKLGAYAGITSMDDKASATDLYNKYSAQLVAGLAQKGGLSTDAARELVLAGTPNNHMQPAAAKEAIDGLVAREQMTQARTKVLQPFATSRNPQGYQQAASAFDQTADPRLWQMKNMTPQQLQGFVGRMSPADKQTLAQKYIAAKNSGWIQ